MDTPVCNFIRDYCEKNTLRLHMPGHKGKDNLQGEALDITEIKGADSLFDADGIIAQSEKNAGSLFGCSSFYSAEGSSLCIRAMVYLTCLYAREKGEEPLIFAGRNAHKSFLSAVMLCSPRVKWLYGKVEESYLSCCITAESLEEALASAETLPTAVYITSPDYLGNMTDLASIGRVCEKYKVLLLVDNAHGAYLRFLPESLHPMDSGAHMCCDSAHKTLPCLTGSAYLHIAHGCADIFRREAKNAMALFASTSPSYLILQSLDKVNPYLEEAFPRELETLREKLRHINEALVSHGYSLISKEPLKITIAAKSYGYTGDTLGEILREKNIECEFSDPDFLVFMFSPSNTDKELSDFLSAMLSIEKKPSCKLLPPGALHCKKIMSPREAMMSPRETLPLSQCLGRVLAQTNVGCPPAVPIVISGEQISESAVKAMEYYGIKCCSVVKNQG